MPISINYLSNRKALGNLSWASNIFRTRKITSRPDTSSKRYLSTLQADKFASVNAKKRKAPFIIPHRVRKMACHLCSSPSFFFRNPQTPSRSLPSSSSPTDFRLQSSAINTHILSFPSLQFQSRTSLQIHHVSLQDPVAEEAQNSKAPEIGNIQSPDGNSESLSKSYIWVNPSSPRASQLRHKSYDSRYASLVKVAEYLNSCTAIESDVFEALKGLGDNFLEQDAVVVLNNMNNPENALLALNYFQQRLKPKREVILYNVTLKVCMKGRDMERAEKLFDEILQRGVKPDNVTFSTMISCSRMCSLPEKAMEWFEKMPCFGCNPDDVTYSAMIDAYGRAAKVEMAFSLYDRARTEKWRIDPVAFSTLIKIHGQSGNFDGCLNVYEEMKAIGAKPNLVIYNTLLDAMGRARRPWQAKKIYREMISKELSPNWVTYASLLRAYGRARYSDDALNVYKEMKEKGLELNVSLYNTLLAMYADVGYTNEAVEIFEEMKTSETLKPDSWTFLSMITIYSCSGKVTEAEATLNEMLEAGFEPNIFILTSLIQCYGKAKHTDDVVRIFNQLLELGITPDERFCGCLLNVMTQTPKEELCKLANCIERADEKLGYVVRLLVERQDSSEKFKNEASQLFNSIGLDVKKAYCNCLIDLCVNLNLLERACELLDLGITLRIYIGLQSRSQT
ncbi:pentatricopeptide repeat-containing protein At4g16390, chloroplastic-like [Malus domestica]|uniref:pentatricopeptide repeat-containing protein At4g16390, chloroplastic-like n=1 Tax=Malus domestica TaxID=3750 RepID=UPI0039763DF8